VFVFEVPGTIFFVPEHDVATLTPEWKSRWRVVTRDGTQGTIPYAPPAGPWVRLGDSWVNPAHLKATPTGEWQDPKGFVYIAGELAPVPEPEPDPPIAELPCAREQVVALHSIADSRHCRWETDVGDFVWKRAAYLGARLHPDLVKVNLATYVNRKRIRRVEYTLQPDFRLTMDSGQFYRIGAKVQREVAKRLGLPQLIHLEPRIEYMEPHWLQDYPVELATASAEKLRAWFPTVHRLIGNLLFQTVRRRQLGLPTPGYGDEYRGFWYHPVAATLGRAGFLSEEEVDRLRTRDVRTLDSDKRYRLYQNILLELVLRRVFTFADLGFADPGNGTLGTARPDVLLVIEKKSLGAAGRRLVDEFGVSMLVTGGSPNMLDTQYFAERVRPHGPLTLVLYVDYDPSGWLIGDGLIKQLGRCGIETTPVTHYIVRAESFTPEEIALYALPCSMEGKHAILTRQWVERSGGIHGEALGIHANHLYPVERAVTRMTEIMASL
jgi:hypothetical protein